MKSYYSSPCLFFWMCFIGIPVVSFGQSNERWCIYEMDSLVLNDTGVYMDKSTISAATHDMDDGSVLEASVYDRMLFVVDGQSKVKIKTKEFDLNVGDVLFLKANESIEISRKLKLMLWTSKSNKTDHKDKTNEFTKKQIERKRSSTENIYDSFIETSTMVAGLYMLPKILNGDKTLTHDFDEINYVVKGRAKFKMDTTVIDVKPGSIMWLKRGVKHHFYDLSDDFDVFILFETIHMDHDH